MKLWSTKYALTKGIMEVDGKREYRRDSASRYNNNERGGYVRLHEKEWHRTHGEAVAWARNMLSEKILALKKELTRLERVGKQIFTNPPVQLKWKKSRKLKPPASRDRGVADAQEK